MSQLEISGQKFHVVHEGEGSPIVFLHGFPLDHSMWKHQRADFKKSHRVIIPCLRGFGESPTQIDAVSLAGHADDLNAILDRLGIREPVVLCGLSMGGYIAFRFWEKYAARVKSLILCDTKATADTEEAAKGRLATADKVLQRGSEVMAEGMLPKLFAKETPPDVIEETKRVIVATSPKTIAAALRALAARPDSTPLLASINVPTLAIVGEHDAITKPEDMEAMTNGISGAKLVRIPNAGHMAPLEQPAAVKAAIRSFLGR